MPGDDLVVEPGSDRAAHANEHCLALERRTSLGPVAEHIVDDSIDDVVRDEDCVELRISAAMPSMSPYWVRCASSAMTTTFRRSVMTASPAIVSASRANFWMVVMMIPPPARSSSVRSSTRLSAWIAGSGRIFEGPNS